jgi:hypothetical protein
MNILKKIFPPAAAPTPEKKLVRELGFTAWRDSHQEPIPGTLDEREIPGQFSARIAYGTSSEHSGIADTVVRDIDREVFWSKVADVVANAPLEQNYRYSPDWTPLTLESAIERYKGGRSVRIKRTGIGCGIQQTRDEVDPTLIHGTLRWHAFSEVQIIGEDGRCLTDSSIMIAHAMGLSPAAGVHGLRAFFERYEPDMKP